MFPTQISQDFIGKTRHWMAHPLLPSLDINNVKRVYSKYEKKVSDDELKRNKRLEPFVFQV